MRREGEDRLGGAARASDGGRAGHAARAFTRTKSYAWKHLLDNATRAFDSGVGRDAEPGNREAACEDRPVDDRAEFISVCWRRCGSDIVVLRGQAALRRSSRPVTAMRFGRCASNCT